MENNLIKKMFMIVLGIGFIIGIGFVVMYLWNMLIPPIMGYKTITYWQAMGLFVLCKILFGGFNFGNKCHFKSKNHFKENMMNMTETERESFKEEWKKRCSRC